MEKKIRRGGVRTPEGYIFELSAGNVSLDFVNTVDTRPSEHPNELLQTYNELFSWGRQAKLLTRMHELNLLKKAARDPKKAESVRKSAIALRECLFQILLQTIEGKEISDELLAKWNQYVQRSMDHHELIAGKGGFKWTSTADPLEFDSFFWPIVHSAVELLTGSNAERIRRCAAEYCDWLFLDESKRGNRRWCDMTICGNRAKANRFYSRKIESKEKKSRRSRH